MWASDGIFYEKFYSIKKRDANVSVSLFLCKLSNILTPNHLKPNTPTRQHAINLHKNRKIMEELLSKKSNSCKSIAGLILKCKFVSGFKY